MLELTIPKTDRESAQARLNAMIGQLPEGKRYRVEVKEERRTRSVQQCRYLNGVAYKLLGDATGYDRDDISEYLCGEYFGWKQKKVPPKGATRAVPVRTTTVNEDGERAVLNWSDFADYVAFVQRFGANHGILIPDPDPEMREAA